MQNGHAWENERKNRVIKWDGSKMSRDELRTRQLRENWSEIKVAGNRWKRGPKEKLDEGYWGIRWYNKIYERACIHTNMCLSIGWSGEEKDTNSWLT